MPRIIFLLLVLGNLAFFAWDRYLRAPLDPQAHIQQVQITPEKIRLAAPGSPAVARPPAAPIVAADIKAAGACVEWGTFIGPEAARGDTAIAELALPATQVRRVSSDLIGYWVMMPALKSRAEATKATEDLKALGVNDYSIVTDAPWRNAISLGVFRTEEAAQILLAALSKKGVTDAVMEKRDAFFRQVVFYVREPTDATVAKLTALRAANAGTEIKAVRCPAP